MKQVKHILHDFNQTISNDAIFDENEDLINQYRLVSFELFCFFGLIISGCSIIIQIISLKLPSFYQALAMFTYCIVMFFVYTKYCLKKPEKVRKIVYYFETPILLWAILMSTVLEPNAQAFIFTIQIIILPLFIFDQPKRVVTYICVMLLIFMILAYVSKDPEIFYKDLVHLAVYGPASIFASTYVLHIRLIALQNEVKANYLAAHDPLTNCYNRRGGQLAINKKHGNAMNGSFIIFDIDDFKLFNDEYGHHTGDIVLTSIATILQNNFRDEDYIARIGGDEFAVYSTTLIERETLEERLKTIQSDLRYIDIPNCKIPVTVSIGAVIYKENCSDVTKAFEEADNLLYKSKRDSKNCYFIQELI